MNRQFCCSALPKETPTEAPKWTTIGITWYLDLNDAKDANYQFLINNSSPLHAEVGSRNWKCTRFAQEVGTKNGKGSPGKVEETTVHTPIAPIFYFAFLSALLGAEFCINFTSTLFKVPATKQRQTNFKHTFNLSKTDATTLQSQFWETSHKTYQWLLCA